MTSTKNNSIEEEIKSIYGLDYLEAIEILKAKREIKEQVSIIELIETSNSIEDLVDIGSLLSLNRSVKIRDRIYLKLEKLLKEDPSLLSRLLSTSIKQFQDLAKVKIFLNENFYQTSEEDHLEYLIEVSMDEKVISEDAEFTDFSTTSSFPNVIIKTSDNLYFSDNGKLRDDINLFADKNREWLLARKINLEELKSFKQIFNLWELVFKENKMEVPLRLNLILKINQVIDFFDPTFYSQEEPTILLEHYIKKNLKIFQSYQKNLEAIIVANPKHYSLFLTSKDTLIRNSASSIEASKIKDALLKIEQQIKLSNMTLDLLEQFYKNRLNEVEFREKLEEVIKDIKTLERIDLDRYKNLLIKSLRVMDLLPNESNYLELINLEDQFKKVCEKIKTKTGYKLEIPSKLRDVASFYKNATSHPDVFLAKLTSTILHGPKNHYHSLFVKIVEEKNIGYLNQIILNQNTTKARVK